MSKSLKIIYAGTPYFAVPALHALLQADYSVIAVYTQPDRPAGRGQKLQFSPVKQLAHQHAIPIYQPISLREPYTQEELRALRPDLLIVAAYGLLLPESVLTIPRYGCLNIHASLLPRWRGAAPIQYALLAGDQETGITLMQMEKGLDTGPIWQQRACPISDAETTESLQNKLAQLGAELLLETLPQIIAGQHKPIPQDSAQATYAPKITKADAQLNWQLSAVELARQVRAYNPWPIAFTRLHHEPIRVWQAQALTEQGASGTKPGSILAVTEKGIDVATRQGNLRLQVIQFPGSKPQPIASLLNSAKYQRLLTNSTHFNDE